MRLYLIRHGETDYNLKRRIQGHSEIPLNEKGLAQAACLGKRMANMPLERIYASDLRRAEMTASVLSEETGVPVQHEPLFRERHPGLLTHRTYEEAEPFFKDPTYEPPEGESVPVFVDRVRKAFKTLLAVEGNTSNNVAVVTHGMVCAAFMRVCLKTPRKEILSTRWPHTSVTIADYKRGWRLVTLTDSSHLDDLEDPAPHSTGA